MMQCEAEGAKRDGRGESPRLGLISAASGEQEEDQHSSAQGDERCAGDRCLLAATEHTEDEHEPESQTREDRAEDDQADVHSPPAFPSHRVGGVSRLGSGVEVAIL